MFRRHKILLVDDEPAIVDTLTLILEAKAFDVCRAYSGQSAIVEARKFIPDVLMSDVMMADRNGLEVSSAVRVFAPFCKVILFTGNPAIAENLLAASPGQQRWELLIKPVSPEELLAKLHRLLAWNRLGPPTQSDPLQRLA